MDKNYIFPYPLVKVLILLIAIVLNALNPAIVLADIAYGNDIATAITIGNTTSLQISKPSGTAVGDFLLAVIAVDRDAAHIINAPSGWTQVDHGESTGPNSVMAIFYKFAGVSESGSYTFTWNNADRAVGAILRYTGVDTTDPINIKNANTGTSNAAGAPSVVTTVDGARIVRVACAQNATMSTTPATQRTRLSNSGDVSLGVSDAAQVSAGATGIANFTLSTLRSMACGYSRAYAISRSAANHSWYYFP